MLFQINESWKENLPHIEKIVGPNLIFYTMMELSLNHHFFILELLSKEGKDQQDAVWRTFFIEALEMVLTAINSENVDEHKLSLFVPRNHTNRYDIAVRAVKEIYVIPNEHGQDEHLFICNDGSRFIDGFLLGSKTDFISKISIYKK